MNKPNDAGSALWPLGVRPLRDALQMHPEKLLTLLGDFPALSWSRENLERDLTGKWDFSFAGYTDSGQMAGLVVASTPGNCVYLHLLLVAHDLRGQGIGCALMTNLENLALRARLELIRLQTDATWTNSVRFYRLLGFTVVDSLSTGNLVMEKRL